MSIFEAALSEPWAIRPGALETILAIADRTNEVTPEALEAYRAQSASRDGVLRVRDDVAIIDFTGPMFKKANMFQAMSGATSYTSLALALNEALDERKYAGVIGLFDTPGGAVNGCDELGSMIFDARGRKPMIAVVSGQACSAGYWLATAFDKVVLSEASEVGSIGVILGLTDTKEADAKAGRRSIEFISSKAPNKRPNYDTDEGKAVYQRRADNLGELFIATVAKHRGVSAETVAKEFGAGGVEIGARAVELKMADEIGTFETAFKQLTKSGNSRRSTRPKGASSMANEPGATGDDKTFTQAELNAAVTKALADSEARRTAITGSDAGKANPKLAATLVSKQHLSAEDAIAILTDAGPAAVEKTDAEKAKEFKDAKVQGDGLSFAGEAGEPNKDAFDWDSAFNISK